MYVYSNFGPSLQEPLLSVYIHWLRTRNCNCRRLGQKNPSCLCFLNVVILILCPSYTFVMRMMKIVIWISFRCQVLTMNLIGSLSFEKCSCFANFRLRWRRYSTHFRHGTKKRKCFPLLVFLQDVFWVLWFHK